MGLKKWSNTELFILLITGVILVFIFVLFATGFFNHTYTFYENGNKVVCKDSMRGYCGYDLYQCSDGNKHSCVGNVIIDEELK